METIKTKRASQIAIWREDAFAYSDRNRVEIWADIRVNVSFPIKAVCGRLCTCSVGVYVHVFISKQTKIQAIIGKHMCASVQIGKSIADCRHNSLFWFFISFFCEFSLRLSHRLYLVLYFHRMHFSSTLLSFFIPTYRNPLTLKQKSLSLGELREARLHKAWCANSACHCRHEPICGSAGSWWTCQPVPGSSILPTVASEARNASV